MGTKAIERKRQETKKRKRKSLEEKLDPIVRGLVLTNVTENTVKTNISRAVSACLEKMLKKLDKATNVNNNYLPGTCLFLTHTSKNPKIVFDKADLDQLNADSGDLGFTFPRQARATHLAFLKKGLLPQKSSDHCSHLCHNSNCIEHVVWESADNNGLREICNKSKACVCNLHPSCIIINPS